MKKGYWVDMLVKHNVILEKDYEIYKFGIECLSIKFITLLIFMAIAVMLGNVVEMIIIYVTFKVMRECSGGFHANTRCGCIIFTCSNMYIALLISNVYVSKTLWICMLIGIDIVLFLFSPVDNHNNRLSEVEKMRYRTTMIKRLILFHIGVVFTMYCNIVFMYTSVLLGLFMISYFVILGWVKEKI